ncbi:MAG: CRISPR-associated endoribonuclease Cas6 [Salinibacter sp.]
MRLELQLTPPSEELVIPRQYNPLLQGLLYHHLDKPIAQQMHEEGFRDPQGQRPLKFFTFSRLLGKWQAQGDRMVFRGPIRWVVASPYEDLLASLFNHLLTNRQLRLGDQPVEVAELSAEPAAEWSGTAQVKMLSPVTVYSTLYTAEGTPKTYYYSPFEGEFEDQVLKNLQRKARVWYGEEFPLEGRVRPVKASSRDQHIVKFKGTVIKAWTGIYELDLSPAFWAMAYHAGIGAKNSQGFGCIVLHGSSQEAGSPRAGGTS